MKRRKVKRDVEVYPKRDPSTPTTNRLPDLSIPDRNGHVTFGKPERRVSSPLKPKTVYDEEMLERERRAQKETEQKKKRVAVICNKGAYQYITATDDPRTIGRK